MAHNDLYIVDNDTPDRSVQKYLNEWCPISKQMDIATGYFEIGGLLAIDGEWQKLEKIRIILGSEVTKRTKEIINETVKYFLKGLDKSLEDEKDKNEFLLGVPAILDALKSKKIECRVFDKNKFHAKAFITYFTDTYHKQFPSSVNIPAGYALVGSSNFTKAGLTQNIELDVQLSNDVEVLQEWFDNHWNGAADITEAILTTIENHCREYSPYDIYLKSMYDYFKSHEQTVSGWEKNESRIYPALSQYQKDGYNSVLKIAEKYRGAFLCDGVGLGKTYVGMMLIERLLIKEHRNVVLIVPAATRLPVWEVAIARYMPDILEGFLPFKIINHSDILLKKNENLMKQIAYQADCIVIDEAHHFRNRWSGRYRKLFEVIGTGRQKQLFLLTATPINNSFLDLQHLIELFTQEDDQAFAVPPLGIHSLKGRIRIMENQLGKLGSAIDDPVEAESILKNDELVKELVVQRSRAYVKKSLNTMEGAEVLFPNRAPPVVADYSLRKSYGKLIDDFIHSFERKDTKSNRKICILSLAIYSPYEDAYFKGDKSQIDEFKQGRQAQVVNLIRILLLKRFESSAAAFEETCIRIFVRLHKFLKDYKDYGNQREIDRFYQHQDRVIAYISKYILENVPYTEEELEDDLPDYVWDTEENLNINDFDIPVIIQDTLWDLEVLADFLEDLMGIAPANDDKINTLKSILSNDEKLKGKKLIIFTEYRSTARYIERELKKAGFSKLFELDGQSPVDRREIIERFAPYYNGKSSKEIKNEIDILVATDVLAEGLNLQDATCLINYELHWNPVRLMQRIGRVDRRRSREIEEKLLKDLGQKPENRDTIHFWNFLPPSDLEDLLSLYQRVSQKTLRISKTLGIEGKQLLTPDDDYNSLQDFNAAYEGTESREEEIRLEYQKLMLENPGYENSAPKLPAKIYSGKAGDLQKGFFFCYELPGKHPDGTWTNTAGTGITGDGFYRWYFLDPKTGDIGEQTYDIWKLIKSEKDTSRVLSISEENFIPVRKAIESHINRSYMKAIQAPLGVKPRLVTWMEID
ncbi:helicase-related protein [Treponema primitia]|uniref:helicase-related protein n=1 Tax=Treponema primitia TaxID=88058 RepID=UPI000570B7A1|nr:helicase-related protein [Treponema primitia]